MDSSQGRLLGVPQPQDTFHAGLWTESFDIKDKITGRDNYTGCCRCEVCHKLFTRLGDLKSHLWIHTKQKPYGTSTVVSGHPAHNSHQSSIKSNHNHRRKGNSVREGSPASTGEHQHDIQSSNQQSQSQAHGHTCHHHHHHIQNELLQGHHSSDHIHTSTVQQHHVVQNLSHATQGQHHVATQNEDHRKRSNPCDTCGKSFSFSNYLSLHKSVHTKEKNFSCDLCPKKFSQPSSRNRHRKKTHKQERCEVETTTSSGTVNMSSQQSHQRSTASAAASTSSTNHHSSSSQKKNSDPCQVCGKIFAFKNYMKSHLRVHSKEKPYACDLCFRRFTQASSRNFHRKRMHKDASLIEPTPQQMAMQPPVTSSLPPNQPQSHDEKPPATFHCKTCVPTYTPYKQ